MNIREVQLLTAQPDQTRHFYHEIMGLKILSADPFTTRFSAGNTVLTFYTSYRKQPVYHFAFNIPHNKFEEAMAWAASKIDLIRVTTSGCVADFKTWNAKAFYFYDNNQNIVEMIARFDADNASPHSFGGSSICCISEIGAVVENPAVFAQGLFTKYGLPFFSRQAPVDDFIAVGNDAGLFIIVTENRIWYPTNTRSSRHWARVTLELPGGPIVITL